MALVEFEQDGVVAVVTINRPESRNAVDRATANALADAFRRFEATRKPRTSRVQLSSRTNTWLRDPTDPGWVYGYDALTAQLADESGAATS